MIPILTTTTSKGTSTSTKKHLLNTCRLALMAAVIVASLTGWWKHFMSRDWVAFVATLVGGYPIFQEAWENLRKRRMTMELSMTIALVAALCIGQFFTALLARAFSSMRRPYAVST